MTYHSITPFHIAAGILALVFGYIALFSKKGASLHRKTGTYFVYAMVTMSLTGAFMAMFKPNLTNLAAGLITFYFVTTGMLSVRRSATPRWVNVAGIVFAMVLGVFLFTLGRSSAAAGRPEAGPMFIFALMATLGWIGDARVMRAGGIQGPRRIARHLWRMCFAMWVAAASFFWGPPGRVPEIINIPALLPIPVLTPVAVMLYWLWRVRVRKTLHGIVGAGISSTTAESVR